MNVGSCVEVASVVGKERVCNEGVRHAAWTKTVAIALLLVLAAGSTLVGCSTRGPEETAAQAVQAYVDNKPAAYYDLLAPAYCSYMTGDNGWYDSAREFQEKAIQDNMDRLLDDLESHCGSDYRATVQAREARTFGEDVLERVRKQLESDYEYERSSIEDVAVVEVDVEASGSQGTGKVTLGMGCVKVDGTWYIHHPGFDGLS